MRDYAATFVGNDYLISQRADEDEKRYSENEMLTSAAEHLVHNAFSDNGIDAYIETTDISFRDSQSHYICIMFESEEDDGDIRRALRGLYESSKTLELVTLTCITHPDWEIRDEAVRSFVEEAIGNACLSDEEEAEARYQGSCTGKAQHSYRRMQERFLERALPELSGKCDGGQPYATYQYRCTQAELDAIRRQIRYGSHIKDKAL